jgi:hypothetical protein
MYISPHGTDVISYTQVCTSALRTKIHYAIFYVCTYVRQLQAQAFCRLYQKPRRQLGSDTKCTSDYLKEFHYSVVIDLHVHTGHTENSAGSAFLWTVLWSSVETVPEIKKISAIEVSVHSGIALWYTYFVFPFAPFTVLKQYKIMTPWVLARSFKGFDYRHCRYFVSVQLVVSLAKLRAGVA